MSHEGGAGGRPGTTGITRRRLLGVGLSVAGSAGLAAAPFPVVRYLSPAASGSAETSAEIPLDRLGLWQADRVLVRGSPCFVVRTPDQIHAVSGVCTHLGCIVHWQPGRRIFFCPCHGGRFAPDGRVLGGPPPTPLPRYAVTVASGKIRVERA